MGHQPYCSTLIDSTTSLFWLSIVIALKTRLYFQAFLHYNAMRIPVPSHGWFFCFKRYRQVRVFVTGHHMLVFEIISMENGTIVSRKGFKHIFPISQFIQGKLMDEDYLSDMRFVMMGSAWQTCDGTQMSRTLTSVNTTRHPPLRISSALPLPISQHYYNVR